MGLLCGEFLPSLVIHGFRFYLLKRTTTKPTWWAFSFFKSPSLLLFFNNKTNTFRQAGNPHKQRLYTVYGLQIPPNGLQIPPIYGLQIPPKTSPMDYKFPPPEAVKLFYGLQQFNFD
jgi:hypothetical protein